MNDSECGLQLLPLTASIEIALIEPCTISSGRMYGPDWSIQTSTSLNQYKTRRQLGNLDLTPRDLTGKIRTDWERVLDAFGVLRLGAEIEHS